MEPVTHMLTGACLARAGLNRRTAYATLAMTLAAEAPDLDMLWKLRGPVAEFQHHRGMTHTFVGAPLVALAVVLFCWCFDRLRRGRPPVPPVWWRLWIYALLAVLSHILLDFTNSYGIRPFAPFRWTWYSWDIVFIFEPVLFALLVAGLLAPALLGLVDREIAAKRRSVLRGRGWALTALTGVALLYAVRSGEHARALKLLRQTAFDSRVLRVAAEPLPVNPFHWSGIVETENDYHLADVHTRADTVDVEENNVHYKAAVTPAVAAAKQSWLGRTYLSWSQFPLVEDTGVGTPPDAAKAGPSPTSKEDATESLHRVEFTDMRYGFFDLFGNPADSRLLYGTVFVAPNGQVEAMLMNGKPQE